MLQAPVAALTGSQSEDFTARIGVYVTFCEGISINTELFGYLRRHALSFFCLKNFIEAEEPFTSRGQIVVWV